MQIALKIKPILDNKIRKDFFLVLMLYFSNVFYGYNFTHPENSSVHLKLEQRVSYPKEL